MVPVREHRHHSSGTSSDHINLNAVIMSAETAPQAGKPAPPQKPPSRVSLRWAGAHRFDIGREGGPTIRLDSDGETGPSPVDGLLASLAACVSTDVVDILAKRRTPVEELTVDATGVRAAAIPARITHITLAVRIRGAGVERVHAERAVDLAVNKYCSVKNSLDPDIPVEWSVELEG
jgi:putative redox protein